MRSRAADRELGVSKCARREAWPTRAKMTRCSSWLERWSRRAFSSRRPGDRRRRRWTRSRWPRRHWSRRLRRTAGAVARAIMTTERCPDFARTVAADDDGPRRGARDLQGLRDDPSRTWPRSFAFIATDYPLTRSWPTALVAAVKFAQPRDGRRRHEHERHDAAAVQRAGVRARGRRAGATSGSSPL